MHTVQQIEIEHKSTIGEHARVHTQMGGCIKIIRFPCRRRRKGRMAESKTSAAKTARLESGTASLRNASNL